jgi:hypothetical protein
MKVVPVILKRLEHDDVSYVQYDIMASIEILSVSGFLTFLVPIIDFSTGQALNTLCINNDLHSWA